MCGIYGFIGEDAIDNAVEGVKRLEYRGYDSAGVAFINSHNLSKINKNYIKNIKKGKKNLVSVREKGEISNLKKILSDVKLYSNIAISHTRWATHGEADVKNCHPHFSQDGKWAVVHNGIIENYKILKQELDVDFESDTDSEVVVHLLQKEYNGNPLQTFAAVCSKLVGSYALAVIFVDTPDTIFVARQNSPVAVGYSDKCAVVCSDVNNIQSADKVFQLDNGNIALVKCGKVEIFDGSLNRVGLKEVQISGADDVKKVNYPHFMLKEIEEIPKTLRSTISNYFTEQDFKNVIGESLFKTIEHILIVGCGTAYHAGLIGGRVIEQECQIQVSNEIASEFLHKPFLYSRNTLAVFVSQSGETADTLKAVELCRKNRLKTLAITNVKNSTICSCVDYVLYTNAGKEVAVASTKAFNAQLAIFYLLSAFIKIQKKGQNDYRKTIEGLKMIASEIESLKIDNVCQEIASEIKNSESLYMVGRGFDYMLALESSLKLKEISYIHSEAYPAGELKHGTLSLIDYSTFVFAFITERGCSEKTLSNVKEIQSRGGKVIVFSQLNLEGDFYKFIKLKSVEERYMPMYAVVYMQKIAYLTSVLLGQNPDKPRNLAKSVTVE